MPDTGRLEERPQMNEIPAADSPISPRVQQKDYQDLLRALDPFGVGASLLAMEKAWSAHPLELAAELTRFSGDLVALQMHLWKRTLGMPAEDVAPPHSDDTRFTDPAWSKFPFWDTIRQVYLTVTRDAVDMVYSTPDLTDRERRRAAFWAKAMFNAVAPTNFFWSNPVAMQKFVESGGRSLAQGFEQWLGDVRAGDLRMVDTEPFVVGKNLATTPGVVVFRNRLLEVIQYRPLADSVHEIPVVLVAPWINKFYILDLDPKKSLVRYLLEQGFTVFVTSWRNPPADLADVRFEDYLTDGVDAIVDTARLITARRPYTPSATAWAARCSRSTWRGSTADSPIPARCRSGTGRCSRHCRISRSPARSRCSSTKAPSRSSRT